MAPDVAKVREVRDREALLAVSLNARQSDATVTTMILAPVPPFDPKIRGDLALEKNWIHVE